MPEAPSKEIDQIAKPGQVLAGKYRVERMLGAGGMGCVLAAEHMVLRTRVAIKLLLPQAAGVPGATERFFREAQASAALRSEHVARVVDVASTDAGAPFLVMEHLTGHDLRKVVRERGPLPVDEAVEYLLQICDAVLEAHDKGIIHRDLKPANVFVTRRTDGSPLLKVLDFGLAKVLDPALLEAPEDSITHTGLVVGSPHYMSPEQFRSLRKADERSDIWSIGVIAYELLAGRRPFIGEGMAGVMTSVVTEEPEPIEAIRPDLPASLAALIRRCLDKNPNRRPQSVAEIIAGLTSPGSQPEPGRPNSNTAGIPDGRGAAPSGRRPPASSPETNRPVSVEPGDAWQDVVDARRAARDRKARRRWLVAGALIAAAVGAAIAAGALSPRPQAGAGETPAAPPPPTAAPEPPPTAAPEPPPTAAPEPPPTPAQTAAAPGSPAPSATAAPVSPRPASGLPTSDPGGNARKPPAPRATAPAATADPFGKYD